MFYKVSMTVAVVDRKSKQVLLAPVTHTLEVQIQPWAHDHPQLRRLCVETNAAIQYMNKFINQWLPENPDIQKRLSNRDWKLDIEYIEIIPPISVSDPEAAPLTDLDVFAQKVEDLYQAKRFVFDTSSDLRSTLDNLKVGEQLLLVKPEDPYPFSKEHVIVTMTKNDAFYSARWPRHAEIQHRGDAEAEKFVASMRVRPKPEVTAMILGYSIDNNIIAPAINIGQRI